MIHDFVAGRRLSLYAHQWYVSLTAAPLVAAAMLSFGFLFLP
jgi:hypothetical protein